MVAKAGVKTFRGDIQLFEELLREQIPFTFSKYADGEWKILSDKPIDTRNRWNGEFKYDPNDARDTTKRQALLDSFQHQSGNYYVGIGCPCCMGSADFNAMRQACKQPDSRITWANLWVNGNYKYYTDRVVPLFSKFHTVNLVCNNKAQPENLPFKVDRVWTCGTNAWSEDFDFTKAIPRFSTDKKVQGALYLFAAGPLGNLLAHSMNVAEPYSTHLDIGSTLDPWLFPGKQGKTRKYLRGEGTINRHCRWEE